MFDDPIVAETRKRREDYAASLGYDLGRIIADLQSRQGADGRLVIDRSKLALPEETHAIEPTANRNANRKSAT